MAIKNNDLQYIYDNYSIIDTQTGGTYNSNVALKNTTSDIVLFGAFDGGGYQVNCVYMGIAHRNSTKTDYNFACFIYGTNSTFVKYTFKFDFANNTVNVASNGYPTNPNFLLVFLD